MTLPSAPHCDPVGEQRAGEHALPGVSRSDPLDACDMTPATQARQGKRDSRHSTMTLPLPAARFRWAEARYLRPVTARSCALVERLTRHLPQSGRGRSADARPPMLQPGQADTGFGVAHPRVGPERSWIRARWPGTAVPESLPQPSAENAFPCARFGVRNSGAAVRSPVGTDARPIHSAL